MRNSTILTVLRGPLRSPAAVYARLPEHELHLSAHPDDCGGEAVGDDHRADRDHHPLLHGDVLRGPWKAQSETLNTNDGSASESLSER